MISAFIVIKKKNTELILRSFTSIIIQKSYLYMHRINA